MKRLIPPPARSSGGSLVAPVPVSRPATVFLGLVVGEAALWSVTLRLALTGRSGGVFALLPLSRWVAGDATTAWRCRSASNGEAQPRRSNRGVERPSWASAMATRTQFLGPG